MLVAGFVQTSNSGLNFAALTELLCADGISLLGTAPFIAMLRCAGLRHDCDLGKLFRLPRHCYDRTSFDYGY